MEGGWWFWGRRPCQPPPCAPAVPRGEDHHPRGRGRPRAGGWRSLDPAPRRHQNPAQEPSPDADQGPGEPHVPGCWGGSRAPRGWWQPPGPPFQAFESTLKSWEDKQKGESYRAAARPRLSSQQSMEYLTEEESSLLQQLSRAAESLIARSAWGPRGLWFRGGAALLHPDPPAESTRRPRRTKRWSRSWRTPSTPAPWH